MSLSLENSPGWQGFYSDAREKISCGYVCICEGAKIAGESASYLAFQAVHMVFPSLAPRLENMYLRVTNIWERVKAYFEKKEFERENAELKGSVQQLTQQLLLASQRENDLVVEVDALKQSNLHMQSQVGRMQKLIDELTVQNLGAKQPPAVAVFSVDETLAKLQSALTNLQASPTKPYSNEGC